MSDLPADSPGVAPPATERWLPGPKPPDEGWTQKKFTLVLVFVLAFHAALVFLLGTKQQILPRAVTQVPRLHLVDNANEFIALGDPTLFASPAGLSDERVGESGHAVPRIHPKQPPAGIAVELQAGTPIHAAGDGGE
jgi:hypothetical protein